MGGDRRAIAAGLPLLLRRRRKVLPIAHSTDMKRASFVPCHLVICPYCRKEFDLFAARWCEHVQMPSKNCPHCERCVCAHPAYQEPHFWKEAPLGFQRQGFDRLFLLYL